MPFIPHTLRSGDPLDLARHASSPHLHVLHGTGRGIQVDIPAGWLSVWWPLRGHLSLSTAGSEWNVASRDVQVWRDGPLRARSLGAHVWLALAGPAPLWATRQGSHDASSAALLPWRGRVKRECAGLLASIFRSALAPTDSPADAVTVFEALSISLLEQQHALQSLLSRCNGRTHERRRLTLLRLLRVRHLIECNPDTRLDLERLSRMANYSPCHLIRLFRGVFDETPSEYAVRLREQQAWKMVCGTGLPICEITEMLGFESQSAFCRAFKNTFGQTTSQVRRRFQQADMDSRQLVAA
ncbi:helix-turn-helix domain-containing protein [Pseudoxanthomonas wuyuanensis]